MALGILPPAVSGSWRIWLGHASPPGSRPDSPAGRDEFDVSVARSPHHAAQCSRRRSSVPAHDQPAREDSQLVQDRQEVGRAQPLFRSRTRRRRVCARISASHRSIGRRPADLETGAVLMAAPPCTREAQGSSRPGGAASAFPLIVPCCVTPVAHSQLSFSRYGGGQTGLDPPGHANSACCCAEAREHQVVPASARA
jgi:hypothetical protein